MFEVLVKVDTKTNEPIIIILLLVEQVAGHPYKIHLVQNSSQLSQVTLAQLCGWYLECLFLLQSCVYKSLALVEKIHVIELVLF